MIIINFRVAEKRAQVVWNGGWYIASINEMVLSLPFNEELGPQRWAFVDERSDSRGGHVRETPTIKMLRNGWAMDLAWRPHP